MKTIYLLFVVFIDSEGYETMQQVNAQRYSSMMQCHIEKSYYKETSNIKFFCGDETKYFNKQQKLF